MKNVERPVIKISEYDMARALEVISSPESLRTFLNKMGAEAPPLKRAFDCWSDKTSDEFPAAMKIAAAQNFDMAASFVLAGLSFACGGFPEIPQEWAEVKFINLYQEPGDRGRSYWLYDILHDELHEMNDKWAGTFCRVCSECGLNRGVKSRGGYIRALLLADIFINAIERDKKEEYDKEHKEQLERHREGASAFMEALESMGDIDRI